MFRSLLPFIRCVQMRNMSSQVTRNLKGKVAIVTASTEGIGLAIARRLGQDGARVMVSSRKQKNVDEAINTLKAEGLDVSGMVCHVGKVEDRQKLIDQTVSQFGGIDILVSNAGINPHFGPILSISEGAWDKIFEVNVKVPLLLSRDVLPHMKKNGGGSIVIVASIGGYNPFPGLGAYSVSKSALLGLTKALANELATDNVRVNCISPGIIKTAFSSALWSNEDAAELFRSQIPMKRFGTANECSGTVSFLVSDDASYITGESIIVAGGAPSRL